MEILRASEDYLESMLMMKLKHGYIRSIDVAEHLGVTKPSVTYATRRLKESGHITMDKDGLISLTETGMAVAAKMLDRHKTLTVFLIALGVWVVSLLAAWLLEAAGQPGPVERLHRRLSYGKDGLQDPWVPEEVRGARRLQPRHEVEEHGAEQHEMKRRPDKRD